MSSRVGNAAAFCFMALLFLIIGGCRPAIAADVVMLGLDSYTDNADGDARTPWVLVESGIDERWVVNGFGSITFDEVEEATTSGTRTTYETLTTGVVGVGYRGMAARADANASVVYGEEQTIYGFSFFTERLLGTWDRSLTFELEAETNDWHVTDDAFITPDENRRMWRMSIGGSYSASRRIALNGSVFHARHTGYLASPTLALDIGGTIVAERLPDTKEFTGVDADADILTDGGINVTIGAGYSTNDWDMVEYRFRADAFTDVGLSTTIGVSYRFKQVEGASFTQPLDRYTAADQNIVIGYGNTDHQVNTYGAEIRYRFYKGSPTPFANHTAAIRGAIDLIRTSDNAFIYYQYGVDRIEATQVSVSMEFRY